MLPRALPLLSLVTVLLAACGGSQTSEPTTNGSSSSGTACTPLEKLAAQCPADWASVTADKEGFCATRQMPDFDVFVSTSACRGRFLYTKHLFDGGPRSCLYDPATGKLAGYRAYDGKARYEAFSCGVDASAYEEAGCSGATC